MEQYPEELRTPPMPLVALVGLHELHAMISMSLQSEQLPLNTLAIPDFSKVAVIGGKERKAIDARMPPPVGILKADWLAKHRTRSPAVLAVLVDRDQVYGDPTQWLQVCANIDAIKNVIRGRNTKLVVAIVQRTLAGEVNEDRLTALRKRAEIDAKHCILFVTNDPGELKRSLVRLGSVMGELAGTFYADEGRRIKLRLEKKTYSSIELSVRYNFKVAVFAEFRRDWVTALKSYEAAYSLLLEVLTTPLELQPVQRVVELKAVAEQLHFKISTLLLHSGKESEAVKWFREHMALYKHLVGPVEGAFLHWAWVSKQFQVFAELLNNSIGTTTLTSPSVLSPGPPVTDRELQPGYYLQLAAKYMSQRRRAFEATLVTFEAFDEEGAVDVLAGSREEVGAPLYVGQAPRLLKRGRTLDLQSPTEAEFMRHSIAVEKGFSHSHGAITLLTRAHEKFKAIQATRMIYQIGCEMGREYYAAREYENAKNLFDNVASMYRKEAWVALLGATLGYLRECARQLGLLKEYVEYALELAALPIPSTFGPNMEQSVVSGPEVGPAGPLCQFQRELVYSDVLGLLQGTGSVLPAREGEQGLVVKPEEGLALEVDPVSPLRIAFTACVAFHDQTVRPGSKTELTISLLTQLPQPVLLSNLEVHFNQPACSCVLTSISESSGEMPDSLSKVLPIKDGYDLQLQPGKWNRLSLVVNPAQSGKLECTAVVARIGPHATIRCQVESPATRDVIPLWVREPGLDIAPVRDSTLAFFGQKAIQVEEPKALVTVDLKSSGPALVGEVYPMTLTVKSMGHRVRRGELFVYLSSLPQTGAAAPRNPSINSSSAVGVAELLMADSSVSPVTHVPFDGPLHIPPLEAEQSWSDTVFVRWLQPKALDALALLNYEILGDFISADDESAAPTFRVEGGEHIECEEALDVSYHYISPFRKDSLLPSSIVPGRRIPVVALPSNEESMFMVTVKNTSSLSVHLQSTNIVDVNSGEWTVRKPGGRNKVDDFVLSSGEVVTQMFYVRPLISSTISVGTIEVQCQRIVPAQETGHLDTSGHVVNKSQGTSITTTRRFPISSVVVETPPLVVSFNCPPHALLGEPFVCSTIIENQANYLQEVSFSVFDTHSFIFAGAHSDTVTILPKSTQSLAFKMVPIAAGMQQLPQVRFASARYSAGFQPSSLNTQLFVYPSAPTIQSPTLPDQHSRHLLGSVS